MTKISNAVFAAVLGTTAAQIACAQSANTGPGATDTRLDTVVVLGTARQDTTALTSTAPVDVITPAQLQETGAITLNQALSRLHPSFQFPQGQNAVKGQGVRAASLRGVGPAYTLILVNGKRRNVSAQLSNTDPWPAAQVVDINVIPVSAVARVEVLRDGAAAQYGSDAIAGVINIILKDDDAGDISAHLGGYTDGGGFTHSVTAAKGLKLGDNGFINLSVDRLKNDNVDRSEADWRQLFPNGDGRNTTYDKKYGQWGQSSRDNWSVLANAGGSFADHVSAYGWINYARKSASNYVNPERVVKAVTNNPTVADGTRISENAVLPIYPGVYQPYMTYTARDLAAVGGVRFGGDALGELDVSVSYGQNETGRDTYNTVNPSWGPDSPTHFYLGSWKSKTTTATADYKKELSVAAVESLVFTAGGLFRHEYWGTADLGDEQGYASGPLGGQTIATLYGPGGVYNPYLSAFPGIDILADTTSRVPATGSSTAGIRPEDAGSVTRDVRGGYAGFDVAITPKLDVGITGRYENYSDFGSTSNHRLTARYEFVPAFALRGTASSGFHAPSLAQLGNQSSGYTSNWSNTGTEILAPGRTRLFRSADPVAAAFGARPLEPEESTTLSLGTVIRPDSSSSITIDAYRLDIKDVIQISETLQGGTITAAFTAAGLAGYTQASYYLNAWDARTDGVDIVGRKQFKFTGSALDVTLSTSFLNTKVRNVNRTVNVGGAPLTVIGNAKIRDAETGIPKNKVILNGRYTLGSWALDATATRYSKYRYNVGNTAGVPAPNGNVDQEFSPETYLDLGIGYQTDGAWRFDVGVQNVFNKYPDKYVTNNRASGINPYSFIAPNGAAGRFVQGGVSYSF